MDSEINYSLVLLIPLIIYVMYGRTKRLVFALKPENRDYLKAEVLFFSIALLLAIGLLYLAV